MHSLAILFLLFQSDTGSFPVIREALHNYHQVVQGQGPWIAKQPAQAKLIAEMENHQQDLLPQAEEFLSSTINASMLYASSLRKNPAFTGKQISEDTIGIQTEFSLDVSWKEQPVMESRSTPAGVIQAGLFTHFDVQKLNTYESPIIQLHTGNMELQVFVTVPTEKALAGMEMFALATRLQTDLNKAVLGEKVKSAAVEKPARLAVPMYSLRTSGPSRLLHSLTVFDAQMQSHILTMTAQDSTVMLQGAGLTLKEHLLLAGEKRLMTFPPAYVEESDETYRADNQVQSIAEDHLLKGPLLLWVTHWAYEIPLHVAILDPKEAMAPVQVGLRSE